MIFKSKKANSELKCGKGAFFKYVAKTLSCFDHLPTYSGLKFTIIRENLHCVGTSFCSPDFSTPWHQPGLFDHEHFNPTLFNHKLGVENVLPSLKSGLCKFQPWTFQPLWLKSSLKILGLKLWH